MNEMGNDYRNRFIGKKRSNKYLYKRTNPMDDRESMELFQDERCTTSSDYYMSGISSAYNDYRDSYNF